MPELDSDLVSWLVGAAVAALAGVGIAAMKKLLSLYDARLIKLESDMDDKVDGADIVGLTNRLTKETEAAVQRIMDQQEALFADAKKHREKQSQQLDDMQSETQTLRVEFTERMTRVETLQKNRDE